MQRELTPPSGSHEEGTEVKEMQDADIVVAEYCSDEEDNFTVKSDFHTFYTSIRLGGGKGGGGVNWICSLLSTLKLTKLLACCFEHRNIYLHNVVVVFSKQSLESFKQCDF